MTLFTWVTAHRLGSTTLHGVAWVQHVSNLSIDVLSINSVLSTCWINVLKHSVFVYWQRVVHVMVSGFPMYWKGWTDVLVRVLPTCWNFEYTCSQGAVSVLVNILPTCWRFESMCWQPHSDVLGLWINVWLRCWSAPCQYVFNVSHIGQTSSWSWSFRADRFLICTVWPMAHVAGLEPYILHDLAHVSWFWSVLCRSCTTSQKGKWGYILHISWSVICPINRWSS